MLELLGVETFYGKIKVLHGISMSVKKGQIAAVLGSNGAGKTTLLRTISGMVEAEYGQIRFNDYRINHLDPDQIVQRGIAHVPQGRMIFGELTVEENLKLGAYRHRSNRRLDQVFTYFPRLKERIKQYAGTLSGGEQQMLSIGRALMSEPILLLLDEPSLGLSPKLVQEIMEVLERMNRDGMTMLLVEQNINLALDVSHHACVLKNGRIFMSGDPDHIREEQDVRELYFGEGKGKYVKRRKIWGRP